MGFILPHSLATRIIPRFWFGEKSDFSIVSHSLEELPYFFYPYYLLLGSSGLYHMAHGVAVAQQVLGIRKPDKGGWRTVVQSARFKILIGVGIVGLTSAVLAFGGWYYEPLRHRYPLWTEVGKVLAGEKVPTSHV